MKTKIGLLTIALFLGIALPAWAAIHPVIEAGDLFLLSDDSRGAQGPFVMTEQHRDGDPTPFPSGSSTNSFDTFCAEVGEHFVPRNIYKVDALSKVSQMSNYYLTPYSAWVYTKYQTDSIWRKTIDTPSEFNSVQNAIWAGMVKNLGTDTIGGEKSEFYHYYGSSIDWTALSYTSLGITLTDFDDSVWKRTNAGTGNVYVANLHGYNGSELDGYAQDQLVLSGGEGDPPTGSVPEPLSLCIWLCLGLCVAGKALWLRQNK